MTDDDDVLAKASELLHVLAADVDETGVPRATLDVYSPDRLRRFYRERSDDDLRVLTLALVRLFGEHHDRAQEGSEAELERLRAVDDLIRETPGAETLDDVKETLMRREIERQVEARMEADEAERRDKR